MKELLIAVTICNPVALAGDSGATAATYKKFFDIIMRNKYISVAAQPKAPARRERSDRSGVVEEYL